MKLTEVVYSVSRYFWESWYNSISVPHCYVKNFCKSPLRNIILLDWSNQTNAPEKAFHTYFDDVAHNCLLQKYAYGEHGVKNDAAAMLSYVANS